MGITEKPKTALILGSGALKIGEAGEFDYSGSQCLKALREEGIYTILINPNIATIQTSEGMADKIYFLPVTPYFVEQIIRKEKPESILLSFGGQTALNCGVALHKQGTLQKYHVRVLGTPVETVIDTEDRDRFVKRLHEISVKTPQSIAVTSVHDGLTAAKTIGYPVMTRVAYALGGRGSGIAKDEQTLREVVTQAFTYTPQVLIEEWLGGWKEIEYEVVRDGVDNCITVCNMENFDPLGIHTGESIVVAPSQTLTNSEYHKLREISLKVIRHLGIVGECNIQFALDPRSEDYRIIEVNARLSRSSALASKATGYPLAFVAAKLALGYTLPELENSVTRVTKACFEPALDYVVVKIPRWDLKKFRNVSNKIGSEMKSVGEVMAIGRKFEEALQKAIRMLHIGMYGLVCNTVNVRELDIDIREPTDERIFAIVEALKNGFSIERIHGLSGIDPWFLYKIQNIIHLEQELAATRKNDISSSVSSSLFMKAKQHGFSDKQIGMILDKREREVRELRKQLNIFPVVKQIDTLAAEYPAQTNYLYLTYNGQEDDITFQETTSSENGTKNKNETKNMKKKKKIIVLGSGSYKIGSSVEFDWCCVSTVNALRKRGFETIMVNYNPETVSTDYDIVDKLYFEELSFEAVADIYDKEQPLGLIVSMGGQIPNTLALKCHEAGMNILGTSPLDIDRAEDRHKFSQLLDSLRIDQPMWKELTTFEDAAKFSEEVGYPILVRPSYVLSGAAMNVAFNRNDLQQYLSEATHLSPEYPVVLSKFITNAREIELDGVAYRGAIVFSVISEHLENAGVHSGDATIILPPQRTYIETIRRIKTIAKQIAHALHITGPFNIQFIAKENEIKVIECNLRASRSFPFVSKVLHLNLIDLATKAILGEKSVPLTRSSLELDYVGVKAPQFSFSRLKGADPTLHVEMASTGEVACLGDDLHEAFLKAMIATGFVMPKKNVLVSIGGDKTRYKLISTCKRLQKLGFVLYATEHTHQFLMKNGVEARRVYKAHETGEPNILTLLRQKKIDLVVSIPNPEKRLDDDQNYVIRRATVDYSVPLINNVQIFHQLVEALTFKKLTDLKIKAWHEYL
ncbi:carbamoyl-phosphate synthase (glutamine-hydrolyzing) large subunit [Candidatus Woesearchaeota archaeon]|nr:carbamoyl-phosphate synthase (glutamine-hydrolyzing) large subunit [Candidatus Woesearchaeota archaeon]